MRDLVEYIVKQLVVNKEQVVIAEEKDNDATIIRVSVAESDVGKVIGRNGRVAQAIRAIVRSASSKTNDKYIVKID